MPRKPKGSGRKKIDANIKAPIKKMKVKKLKRKSTISMKKVKPKKK